MKIIGSILVIILGILLFRVGHNLLDQVENDKPKYLSENEFWSTEIKYQDFSPNFFFKSIPAYEVYPDDGIIYFKYTGSYFREDLASVKSNIIQNNHILYKNTFIFNTSSIPELISITNEDTLTGIISKIEDESELKSLMSTYKGFIDLWMLYNIEE